MNDWSPFLGLPLWVWLFVLPLAAVGAALLAGPAAGRVLAPAWRALDAVYLGAGIVAALALLAILALIVAQMVTRWMGVSFPGSTAFAGYAMAAASFFALAHTLRRGAHIRVSVLLGAGGAFARWLDLGATVVAAAVATYLARFAVKANGFSAMLNDRTQGQDQIPGWVVGLFGGEAAEGWVYTPIWIPQLSMSIGTILLAICLWDMAIRAAALRRSVIVTEAVE